MPAQNTERGMAARSHGAVNTLRVARRFCDPCHHWNVHSGRVFRGRHQFQRCSGELAAGGWDKRIGCPFYQATFRCTAIGGHDDEANEPTVGGLGRRVGAKHNNLVIIHLRHAVGHARRHLLAIQQHLIAESRVGRDIE